MLCIFDKYLVLTWGTHLLWPIGFQFSLLPLYYLDDFMICILRRDTFNPKQLIKIIKSTRMFHCISREEP